MSDQFYRPTTGLEFRAEDTNDGHTITLQLLSPAKPDTFGTLWHPGALDKGLAERMPVLNWDHDGRETIGRAIDYATSDTGPRVRFLFDDFDAVPRARQAWTQVQSRQFEGRTLPPAITDCSIAFMRVPGGTVTPTPEQRQAHKDAREYVTEAVAVHAGLVQRGSVHGAKVLAVRSASGVVADVAEEFVVDLARQVAAGTMTKDEALIAVDLAAGQAREPALPDSLPGGGTPDESEIVEAEAELDQILDEL